VEELAPAMPALVMPLADRRYGKRHRRRQKCWDVDYRTYKDWQSHWTGCRQLGTTERMREAGRLKSAEEVMRDAGADFVVEDLTECDRILAQIGC
jgi:hypothetical protein